MQAMSTIWFIDYDLGRFTMHAFGATPEDALGALVRGVQHHVHQTEADPQHMTWCLEAVPQEVTLGVCYRDGTPCGPHGALQHHDLMLLQNDPRKPVHVHREHEKQHR